MVGAVTPSSSRSPRRVTLGDAQMEALAAGDPRYADLFARASAMARMGTGHSPGRLSKRSLAELRRRVATDAGLPLEDALARYVAALAGREVEDVRVQALLARFGLAGAPPLTLQEAGALLGVTGERIRQLAAGLVRNRASSCPFPYLPQVDVALTTVAGVLPLRGPEVGPLLMDAGVAAGPFSIESLAAAAAFLGRPLPFTVSTSRGETVVLALRTGGVVGQESEVAAAARRLARRCGAATVAELAPELRAAGVLATRRQVLLALEQLDDVAFGTGGWFWLRGDHTSGTFVRASLRMLAVKAPLPLASLREGLCRRCTFRRLPAPPPETVLREVYAASPFFVVGPDGAIAPRDPAAAESELSGAHRRLVELMKAAPGGILDRNALQRAAHDAGLSVTTANCYAAYSECVERVGRGLFAARGTVVAPAGEGGRARPVRRAGVDQVVVRTADGKPVVVTRLTASSWGSGVLHIPAVLRREIGGGPFEGLSTSGEAITTVTVDRHGNSWGWAAVLRGAGAEPGDVVRATFDEPGATVVIEVGGPDLFGPT